MQKTQRALLALSVVATAPWLIATSEGPPTDDDRTIIIVSGRAEQPQQPPSVVLMAGVESDAESAAGAMNDNARTIMRLREVLGRMSIQAQDVRTTNLALAPRRDNNDSDRILGFRATHQLSIVFRDIEQSGRVIDALVEVGANNIQGPRISRWRHERVDPAARHAAIVDANNQAEAYARSLGLRVRRVLKMTDGWSHVIVAAGRTATEIMPGEETVQTVVNAEYELAR